MATLIRALLVLPALSLMTTIAAAQTPPPAFPATSRIAFVDVQYVFAASREGKAAANAIQAFESKKKLEIDAKSKEVETLQQKLTQGTTLVNDEARGRMEREVARARVDFERLIQDAQSEVQDMQQQFQRAFSRKLFPAIGEIAKSRDLWAVFRLDPDNVLWHQNALDISSEVVVRLDTAPTGPRQ